jgi:type II secretory pathway component PulC
MRSRVSLVLALSLCSCAGAAPAASPPNAAAKALGAASSAPPSLPDHSLRRSAIREVLSQGLGVFLQRVDLDDRPVRVDGKFHGFRIVALRDAQFWGGVDLKPGDVVTRVNGFPIERPEQAQTAFDSLQVASELRVAYDRDGQARELVYAIVDDR